MFDFNPITTDDTEAAKHMTKLWHKWEVKRVKSDSLPITANVMSYIAYADMRRFKEEQYLLSVTNPVYQFEDQQRWLVNR